MKKKIDKKLILLLLLFFATFKCAVLIKNIVLKYFNYSFIHETWLEFLKNQLIIDVISGLTVTFLVFVITNLMINRGFSIVKIFILHILVSLVIVFISSIIYFGFQYLLDKQNFTYSASQLIYGTLLYFQTSFLFYFANVLLIYMYNYAIKLNKSEIQKSEIQNQLIQTQLNVLKYQLHPHFFFNTLNSISTLIDVNPKKAQNLLADFSDLLREITDLKNVNLLTLNEEMNILKKYMDIMRIRFTDDLKIVTNITSEIGEVLIPSLLLQPIIENSIKYGYSYNHTKLKITLNIFKQENSLIMKIDNDGEPLKNNELKYGTGLKNTINRLKTLYQENYSFSIKNKNESVGVETIIKIPIQY